MIYKIISILCFSSLPFMSGLNGEFVFDDAEAVVKNKDVYSLSWIEPFYNDFWGTEIKSNVSHKSYRPLTILSYRLNYLLSGNILQPSHFKTTNLICHSLCCFILWHCYQKLLNTKVDTKCWRDKSLMATILFCVHPVHVESVCGVVGRADLLAAITFFLAFLIYHKAIMLTNKISYIYLALCIIVSGISMLFKENGVTVLGFCICYEVLFKFRNSKRSEKTSNYKLTKESIFRIKVLILAALCMLYGRWIIMDRTKPLFKSIDNPAAFSNNSFTKISSYNYIYFLNILLLLWPQWLCYDWSMGCVPLIENVNDYRIIFVVLMYVYGVYVVKKLFDKNVEKDMKRHITLAILLIAIPFLPASNIFFPVGFVIAERVLYTPSAGYCLLIVIGYDKIIQRKKTRKIGVSLFIMLIIIFAFKTWRRSQDWRNEYNLFTSGLSVCPLNAKVHYNVAKVADASSNTTWALEEYREAIRLNPEYYQAMNNLANLLKNNKQYSEAEYYLRRAISYKHDFPAAWMNLGIVLANTKRYDESKEAYENALKHRKNYPDCFYNLGNLYLELNKTHKAMESWFAAIKLNSKHNLAWTNLLALLDNTGQVEMAFQVIPKALMSLPDSPSVNFAIANIYGKIEKYEDAEKHFKRAIDLFGKRVQAIHYANLGVLYHRWKKYDLALDMYEKALRIDHNFVSALRNMKSLKRHFS